MVCEPAGAVGKSTASFAGMVTAKTLSINKCAFHSEGLIKLILKIEVASATSVAVGGILELVGVLLGLAEGKVTVGVGVSVTNEVAIGVSEGVGVRKGGGVFCVPQEVKMDIKVMDRINPNLYLLNLNQDGSVVCNIILDDL